MKESAMIRMLKAMAKGRIPEASDLGLGKEQFVALVSEAAESGYIDGVYISSCDSQSVSGLLSMARLTEKGRAAANVKKGIFSVLNRKKNE